MSRVNTYQVKKNRTIAWIVFSFSILFILTSVTFWLLYPFPSNEKVDYFKQENSIIYQDKLVNDQAIYEDQTYLPFTFIQKYIDPSIRFDENSSSVIVTTNQKVIQMPSDSLTYYLNNGPIELSFPVVRSKEERIYLATEWLEKVYPIKSNYFEDTKAVQIYTNNQIIQQAIVLDTEDKDVTRLRLEPTLSSPYVEELDVGSKVAIEDDNGSFFKVRTGNGVSGYMKKSALQLTTVNQINTKETKPEAPFQPTIEWPVHVTWDAIYKSSANKRELPALDGVQVVSPTWFELKNGEGDLRNIASKEYVRKAKQNNYQIWALFSNGFESDRTQQALATFETRQKIIKQLLSFAEIYDLDGINIDFENVYEKDGANVTQFVRELTPLAHEAGLVVSMDITFISGSGRWSKFYDREKLAETVDYLMVMAYDEHWGSSPVAGSVSSLPWVERNLNRLLEVVPHDRLILGVPLYTRLWKIETLEDGTKEVTSKSMKMDAAQEWMKERGVTPTYEKASGQDYVEYKVPDQPITYKMWLENETSLRKRAKLVHQYQLAGIASWSRYFANEESWSILDDELSHRKIIEKNE